MKTILVALLSILSAEAFADSLSLNPLDIATSPTNAFYQQNQNGQQSHREKAQQEVRTALIVAQQQSIAPDQRLSFSLAALPLSTKEESKSYKISYSMCDIDTDSCESWNHAESSEVFDISHLNSEIFQRSALEIGRKIRYLRRFQDHTTHAIRIKFYEVTPWPQLNRLVGETRVALEDVTSRPMLVYFTPDKSVTLRLELKRK